MFYKLYCIVFVRVFVRLFDCTLHATTSLAIILVFWLRYLVVAVCLTWCCVFVCDILYCVIIRKDVIHTHMLHVLYCIVYQPTYTKDSIVRELYYVWGFKARRKQLKFLYDLSYFFISFVWNFPQLVRSCSYRFLIVP